MPSIKTLKELDDWLAKPTVTYDTAFKPTQPVLDPSMRITVLDNGKYWWSGPYEATVVDLATAWGQVALYGDQLPITDVDGNPTSLPAPETAPRYILRVSDDGVTVDGRKPENGSYWSTITLKTAHELIQPGKPFVLVQDVNGNPCELPELVTGWIKLTPDKRRAFWTTNKKQTGLLASGYGARQRMRDATVRVIDSDGNPCELPEPQLIVVDEKLGKYRWRDLSVEDTEITGTTGGVISNTTQAARLAVNNGASVVNPDGSPYPLGKGRLSKALARLHTARIKAETEAAERQAAAIAARAEAAAKAERLRILGPGYYDLDASMPSGEQVKTQKARGIAYLRHVPTGAVSLSAVVIVKEHGLEDAVMRARQNYGSPLFIRPAPVKPAHGFVDSVPLKPEENALDRVRELWQKAKTADPEAELILCGYREADYSAIWTPGRLSWGPGHDGATSGHGSRYVPLAVSDAWANAKHERSSRAAASLKAAGIVAPDVPFIEYVVQDARTYPLNGTPAMFMGIGKHATRTATQLRAGPAIPQADDYVPAAVTVTRVLTVPEAESERPDLLEWQASIKELAASGEAGVVVYLPGQDLASHYAIHPQVAGIPVLCSRMPVVGETLTPTAQPDYDDGALIEGIRHGLAMKIPVTPEESASEYVAYLSAVTHSIGVMRERHTYHIGVAAALMLRYGSAASLGELRHSKGSNKGERNTVYDKCRDYLAVRRRLSFARHMFFSRTNIHGKPLWGGNVGGPKWGQCTDLVITLDTILLQALDGNAGIADVSAALNAAVDAAHNGGWWLNKWCPPEVFTDAADCGPMAAVMGLPVFRRVVEERESGKRAMWPNVPMRPIHKFTGKWGGEWLREELPAQASALGILRQDNSAIEQDRKLRQRVQEIIEAEREAALEVKRQKEAALEAEAKEKWSELIQATAASAKTPDDALRIVRDATDNPYAAKEAHRLCSVRVNKELKEKRAAYLAQALESGTDSYIVWSHIYEDLSAGTYQARERIANEARDELERARTKLRIEERRALREKTAPAPIPAMSAKLHIPNWNATTYTVADTESKPPPRRTPEKKTLPAESVYRVKWVGTDKYHIQHGVTDNYRKADINLWVCAECRDAVKHGSASSLAGGSDTPYAALTEPNANGNAHIVGGCGSCYMPTGGV